MKKSSHLLLVVLLLILVCCHYEGVNPTNPSEQTIPIKVTTKIKVGNLLFENIETTVVAKGYDESNTEIWSNSFSYAGPDANVFLVRNGLHHYTISFEKWGVSDSQTITSQDLINGRADGSTPVTFGLGGEVPYIKKPTLVIEYLQVSDDSFQIISKTEFNYDNSGKIERSTFYNYSPETSTYIPYQYSIFTYDADKVSLITDYLADTNQKISESVYGYNVDDSLLKITETNQNTNLVGTLLLNFNGEQSQNHASYQFSNGAGFDYHFNYELKNIVSDKTVNGGQLCNQGSYTFDRNINPFIHLGYINFTLNNFSANNKVTENVEYSACSFPSAIPDKYTYVYDDMGYPTKKTTTYKGSKWVSATKYYYQSFPQ